jgi:hypothetical protein
MWAEDDHLVFLGEGGLYRVPFVPSAGGATEPIIARDSLLFAGAWALDRDALYWTREGEVSVTSDPWNVWRTPRDGGDDQIVSVISDSQFNFYDRLVSLPDRLIVYSDITFSRAPAWSIPKAGGDAVALPSLDKGTVIGVGHDGAVFSYRGNAGIESTRFEVARWLPGDAAVQPFWTSKPPAAQPSTFWSDGVGGGIVVATEPTNDGLTHVSVWAVDSAGNGRRLACDPEVAREVLTGVVGPDAVYLAMTSAGGSYWQLVAVSRAGS